MGIERFVEGITLDEFISDLIRLRDSLGTGEGFVYMERVHDSYFEQEKGWETVTKLASNGILDGWDTKHEYFKTTGAYTYDDDINVYIDAHY